MTFSELLALKHFLVGWNWVAPRLDRRGAILLLEYNCETSKSLLFSS